ncbi:hypothetical protein N7462_010738 [Penicillium macrosclerotiorum]|uniref:uncharacterized protein n=1 Tax=Penicillium macrosclerotiorum TaxID=303699 RepID=UPI002547402C|nr:uncharacterized protein N7462_010738 [Penicillium macrosclerotiorum]KAJ5669668.1 hypothetical protein N7462_010738 [Penicillium macrosclerotiorum]
MWIVCLQHRSSFRSRGRWDCDNTRASKNLAIADHCPILRLPALDRPLTHINKKGRPVSQCPHCRGLRKSRTTHVKCECGDKKKKHDSSDSHGDKRDLKQDALHRCGCHHGQRCTCALKKEPHLDPVPETGLPISQPTVPAELPRKPHLTSTKSESTLTIFRDGHHKPAHKHNDMAHKCGLPYTIPRSHTIHHPSDMPRRSVDHLPLAQPFIQEPLSLTLDPRSQSQSQQSSPDSVPSAGTEEVTTASLDPSFLDAFAASVLPSTTALENPTDGTTSNPTSTPASMDKFPLEQIMTSIPPPLDVSTFTNYQTTTTNSPITCLAFQDPYHDPYFASPDSEVPLGSAGLGAPSVDWSHFPLYSNAPTSTSTQTPSYASFDYSYPTGLPPPSSSGDISEVDEFGPLPGLGHAGNDMHDLHSVSEASDMDHLRVSSASSLVGLPQTQLLSSNDLESISIDDFLKSANESTAALEHQLQAGMGLEPKTVPAPEMYALSQAQDAVPIWPAGLFDDATTPPMDENYFRQSWAQ